MATARNIPTAFPELDYGEPPRDKEPRRSRSRSLRSVANLVLGKQSTNASPNETNSPAPTTRWPSISALRRSQKNALPPPPEVTTTSAGNSSASAELHTRDRRSADIPRRRFSLSRPIRLSLNLARPAKRGAPEVESLLSEVAANGHGEARQDINAYTHSHELRRRLEELEADGASTQVLAGDASSRVAGSVEPSLLDGDVGEASLLEVDGGDASSHEVDGGEASTVEVDGAGPSLLELDGVEPSLFELDAALGQVEVEASSSEVEGDIDSVHDASDPSHDGSDHSHDETGPSLVQARDSLLNIDPALPDIDAAALDLDAAVLADDDKPSHAPAFEDDIEQVGSAKGQPTSPHVAFAEDVIESGPGLPDLVHLCYEDGNSSNVYADTDEEVYHGDEDDGDGYHGDDELLYSSDDEDVYAYPSNSIFDVSSHTSSTASADALNHISTSAVAYAPTLGSPATNITAGMPFTSRPVAIPFTSRPVAIPFTSRAPAAILPSAAPPVPDDAYETHTPQYAAFFSESPSSYDVAMDFLPLSDLEGTPVDEAGASLDEGALSCESAVDGESAADGSDSEGQVDLIFPDEASFPVIYETREVRKEGGEAWKEGGQAWKEGGMPLWSGDLPLEPSLETPSDPVLGPLLSEERGVWREDEATSLPPLQMDRLPWLEGSDEEESPLSPMDGEDSLLSPPSLGAELPILMADSLPFAADNEVVATEGKDSVAGDDQDLPADDDSFALFPTDPRFLPYLLRLSAEYDGTPASELNGSPFPSPLPRSPLDENVLPFASLSTQEIATGHQLVRRGREGVVARRVMVDRQPSHAHVDTTAQVENTTQVENIAQVDSTVLVDFTASSPLDAFLPCVRTPALAPELLDFFPAPSPYGELANGIQLSESRALVRRPTEGELMVVRAETTTQSLSSSPAEPTSFSALLEEAYASSSSTSHLNDRPRRPTLTAMQSALLPCVEPFVLDVRDANGMVVPSQFFPADGGRRPTMWDQPAEAVNRFPADIVLHHPVAALALDTPQLAMLYSPLDTAVLYSPSPLGVVPSPSYFATLRSPLGSIATDLDPFELAVAVRAPREMAVMVRETAHGLNDETVCVDEPALPFTAFLADDYLLPDDVNDEPLPFPGLPSWELAVQMQAHYIEPKLPRAFEAMLGCDDSSADAQASAAPSSATYTLPSVPSTLESMVLGTAKASLVSVQPRSLVSNLVGLGSGGGISPAAAAKSVNSQGTDVDLAEKLAVDAHDIVFIDAESEDPLAPSTSAAHSADPALMTDGSLQGTVVPQGKQAASPLGELPLPDMDFASSMVSAVEGLWGGA